ncbi:MAG TPA: hypothetical protein VI078_09725 [bacterium]
MKRNILFVTDRSDDADGGLSYAFDLARAMDKGIAVLLLSKNRLMNRFESLMTAVAFAEAGEHETAREILAQPAAAAEKDEASPRSIAEACAGSGLSTQISSGDGDMVSAVGSYLKSNRNVEMVLLSPSITAEGAVSSRDFKRLLSTVARPVVTLARQGHVA